MKRYDSYKDSGVEWIGEIPSGWEKSPIKYYYNYKKGSRGQELTKTYIQDNLGDYPVYSGQTENEGVLGTISDFEFDFPEGVIFTTTVGVKMMSTKVLKNKFSLSQNCLIMIPKKEVNSDFVNYFISIDWFFRKLQFPKILQPSLRMEDIDQYFFYYPPLSEQQQIVSFLDDKTSLIDSFIEKNQRKIELLKESITSYVFYKTEKTFYSDYWFQKIPKGWKILKFREVFEDIKDKNHTEERLLSVHQIKGVIYRDEQEESVMDPSGDISNYKLIKEGDFVISLRSSEGGFEFSQVRGLVSPVYTVLRPKFELDTILFKYLFKSENFIQEINRYVTGIREGKTINYEDIRDIPIPVPKMIDTSVILKHQKIFELFHLLEKQNNKLKEYRQSIISEVVTGKKKVIS